MKQANLLEALEARTFLSAQSFAIASGAAVARSASASAGSISGIVFLELHTDRFQTYDEPGLANYHVYLDLNKNGRRDNWEPSRTTNSQGEFSFKALAPATYIVAQVPVGGMSGKNRGAVKLQSAERQVVSFGNANDLLNNPAIHSMQGKVRDSNGRGMAGLEVFLDKNGSGRRDKGEIATSTNSRGNYSFKNVRSGAYYVTLSKVERLKTMGRSTVSVLVWPQKHVAPTFKVQVRPYIHGTVFIDSNGNGVRDAGERPYPNADVTAIMHDLDVRMKMTTDESGKYAFNVYATDRLFMFLWEDIGWRVTSPTYGQDLKLAAGEIVNLDLGIVNAGAIRGKVVRDDQAYYPNTGLPNITVWLDGNNNGALDNNEKQVKTLADGSFEFGAVPLGKYNVKAMTPDGSWYSSDDPQPSQATVDKYELVWGDMTFHFTEYASIHGTLKQDSNHDKTVGADDKPVPNTRVFLDVNANNIWDSGERSTMTDSAGEYRFSNVISTMHRIGVTVPSGMRMVANEPYLLINPGSDVGIDILMTDYAKVSGGARFHNPDGTYTGRSIYYEFVWADLNSNLKFDPGEPSNQYNAEYTFELPAGFYRLLMTFTAPIPQNGPQQVLASATVTLSAGEIRWLDLDSVPVS
jgi:hypothetical protein